MIECKTQKEALPVLMARLMTQACGKRHRVSLADALEFRRDQYGLTAAQFAGVIGMSPTHYSEVISGKRDIPIKAAKRAFAIGVPADVLLAPSAVRGEI